MVRKKKGLQILEKIFKEEGLVFLWLACWISDQSTRLGQNFWVAFLSEILFSVFKCVSPPKSKGVYRKDSCTVYKPHLFA